MFAAPMIFPSVPQMKAENLPELQTSFFSSPTLCKKLKDMDEEESWVQRCNPKSEQFAKSIEDRYNSARMWRVVKLAGYGSTLVPMTILWLAIDPTIGINEATLMAVICNTLPVGLRIIQHVQKWSHLVDSILAEAKAREAGSQRMQRLQDKIDEIGKAILVASDIDKIQLQKAREGFSRLRQEFLEKNRKQPTHSTFGRTDWLYVSSEDYRYHKDYYIKSTAKINKCETFASPKQHQFILKYRDGF